MDVGRKAFLKEGKSGLLFRFGKLSGSWIRIRIPKTYPDPDQESYLISADPGIF
jgi:hypothetical protein